MVFPNGFPGPGYRLDEWQFERYRARLDRGTLGKAARPFRYVGVFVMAVGLLAIVTASYGAPLLEPLGVSFDSWDLIRLLVISVAVAWTLQRVMRWQLPQEARSQIFDDCPKVSRFAFLPRRVLGMIASRQVSMRGQHLRLLIAGGLGLLLLTLCITGNQFGSENFFLAAILLIWATRPAFFCWVYWHFRLTHGRAPTSEDFPPVDPPAAALHDA